MTVHSLFNPSWPARRNQAAWSTATATATATAADGTRRDRPAPTKGTGRTTWPAQPDSDGFVALLSAYRARGGSARGDDVARLFEDLLRGDYVSLARLIVNGDVFGFKWRGVLWIPMFQFQPIDLAVRDSCRRVRAELGRGLDGWNVATWFITENSALDGRCPVDLLDTDLPRVLQAAASSRQRRESGSQCDVARSLLTPELLASAGRVIEAGREREARARARLRAIAGVSNDSNTPTDRSPTSGATASINVSTDRADTTERPATAAWPAPPAARLAGRSEQ